VSAAKSTGIKLIVTNTKYNVINPGGSEKYIDVRIPNK